MNMPVKCSVTDGLYAYGFNLDEKDMPSNKRSSKNKESKEKKGKAKVLTKLDDAKRPSLGDEDYIVFRFKEDGGIALEEEKSPPPNQQGPIEGKHQGHKVSKKLVFDGSTESLQFKVRKDGVIIPDDEVEEKRSTKSSKKLSPSDVEVEGDGGEIEVITEESNEGKTLSESTRSDSSASSFAFPIMTLETIGSPERMPKYTEQTKIEKILRFPCCKF